MLFRSVLGQPVVPVNKPGAGGAVTYTYVKNAKPDGYTVAWNSTSILTTTNIGNLPFEHPARDHIRPLQPQPTPFAARAHPPADGTPPPRGRVEHAAAAAAAAAPVACRMALPVTHPLRHGRLPGVFRRRRRTATRYRRVRGFPSRPSPLLPAHLRAAGR